MFEHDVQFLFAHKSFFKQESCKVFNSLLLNYKKLNFVWLN